MPSPTQLSPHIPPFIQNMTNEDLSLPYQPIHDLLMRYKDGSTSRQFLIRAEVEVVPRNAAVAWIVMVYEDRKEGVRCWESGVSMTDWCDKQSEKRKYVLDLKKAWKDRALDIAFDKEGGEIIKIIFKLENDKVFQMGDFDIIEENTAQGLHNLSMKLFDQLERVEKQQVSKLSPAHLRSFDSAADKILVKLEGIKKKKQELAKKRRLEAEADPDETTTKKPKSAGTGSASRASSGSNRMA